MDHSGKRITTVRLSLGLVWVRDAEPQQFFINGAAGSKRPESYWVLDRHCAGGRSLANRNDRQPARTRLDLSVKSGDISRVSTESGGGQPSFNSAGQRHGVCL